MMKIFVVVATVGRPELTRKTIDFLAKQSRAPNGVVVVSVSPADVEGVERSISNPEIHFSKRGLCCQRNHALKLLAERADVIVFFDDDFLPAPDFLAETEKLFIENADIVGMTGELIADGIRTGGLEFEEARTRLAAGIHDRAPIMRPRTTLYGCNMVIRMAAAEGLKFDEMLPLYGWQEDIDFTYQLSKRGRLISTHRLTGVHMGVSGGRTSGKKLGYSQVANLIYLWRKGTMAPRLGEQLLLQNLASNLLRSFRPEPHIDRRGRLLGNIIALFDLLRGRIDPRRIETM